MSGRLHFALGCGLVFFAVLVCGNDPAQAGKKLPVPGAKEQADAEELIKTIYKDEYAKLGKKAKLELAEARLKDARDTNDSPAAKFVLQREARDLAASSGNLFLALAAADEMSRDFEVDPGEAEVRVFGVAAPNVATPEQAADVAE